MRKRDRKIAHELLSIGRLLTWSKGDRQEHIEHAAARLAALAARLLGYGGRTPGPPPSKVLDAERWLRIRLAAGPVTLSELKHDGQPEGFSASTVDRAARRLGAARRRVGREVLVSLTNPESAQQPSQRGESP